MDGAYIWEPKPEQLETPFVFYWVGFDEMDLEPQPIWFQRTEDSCRFMIGDQFTTTANATGDCSIS